MSEMQPPVADGEPLVRVDDVGRVRMLTLNRPHALNAMSTALARVAGAELAEADADPGVRVIVVTGAGRAFCAGMDLKEFAEGGSGFTAGDGRTGGDAPGGWGLRAFIEDGVDTPVVAAVNGPAYGFGAELALASDLIVVDEHARLALPEVRRGLFAAAGGVARIMQQVPAKIAMEKLLTGDPISAAEAREWGLANAIAAAGEAVPAALELAQRIAQNAPLALKATKRLATRTSHTSTWSSESWTPVHEQLAIVFASDDAREGASAFAQKREPEWTGR